jgi:hypothetical protein
MLKFAPDRLAGLVLCDPISLLLQHSDVAYNFVYRPSLKAAEMFFEWIAREQGIALTLGRNFHWFDNVFPMIDDDVVKPGQRLKDNGGHAKINGTQSKSNGMQSKANGRRTKSGGKRSVESVSLVPDVERSARFFPRELKTVVFLSERDCIVPTKRIVGFMGKAEGVHVHVMPKLDHGGFLFCEYWLDRVLRTLIEMGE